MGTTSFIGTFARVFTIVPLRSQISTSRGKLLAGSSYEYGRLMRVTASIDRASRRVNGHVIAVAQFRGHPRERPENPHN